MSESRNWKQELVVRLKSLAWQLGWLAAPVVVAWAIDLLPSLPIPLAVAGVVGVVLNQLSKALANKRAGK